MTNLFVRFQGLLGKEPVTRVEVSVVNGDGTIDCITSSATTLRIRAAGYTVGQFVYLKGGDVIGVAPSVTVTEVII